MSGKLRHTFQIISINGEPIAARSWEDTTLFPAFSEIVIRARFLDFPGTLVSRCHVLGHEDRGMMGVVEGVS